MNNTLTLTLNNETIYIHFIDNNTYYFEDTTGIYKMSGNSNDYVNYMKNKGWEIFL